MLKILEKYKKYVYVPMVIYWLLILVLTSLPGNSLPSIKLSDKIEHFLAFFGLSVLLSFTYYLQNKRELVKKYFSIFTLITCSFYGMIDELHQLYIPGRSCDILDWTADTIGAFVGCIVVFIFIKIEQRKSIVTNN